MTVRTVVVAALALLPAATAAAEPQLSGLLPAAHAPEPLTEPLCSYCSTQHRKRLVREDDLVLAWIRGAHNGGAFPIRHFLAAPRVINDTYGLFFYDPDGGYVAAYEKDYGFRVAGWRRGVLVVEGPDGTLWSALSGRALAGPKQGQRLARVPSLLCTWGHWLMLHPESTAYDLFDGRRYPIADLPTELTAEARRSMGDVDDRLPPMAEVLGVELGDSAEGAARAYPLDAAVERACYADELAGVPIAVFWYGPTRSAVAFRRTVDGRALSLYADEIAPETAPFMDRETGSRWTLAGRAVDGPLRGRELEWVTGVQCRWYAWAAEFPDTTVYGLRAGEPTDDADAAAAPSDGGAAATTLRGVVLSADQATDDRLRDVAARGITAVALALADESPAARDAARHAAARVAGAGLALHYWIEIGRWPALADAHPEWMASLQGHQQWRRLFPDFPQPDAGEVVKNYPWVPVLYQEAFDAHLARVERLLDGLPPAAAIYLNDLQGAPSACGCGNVLCRWTADYGPIRTATPTEGDAAARFVAEVRRLAPRSEIVPVWASECEDHDTAPDGACAGVGCYHGECWRAFTAQLMPVAAEAPRIGVLATYRALARDDPRYGPPAGWVAEAIRLLGALPPQRGGEPIAADRLIAVLQGWDCSDDEIAAQVARAEEAGAAGWLVSHVEIDPSWSPRIVHVDGP